MITIIEGCAIATVDAAGTEHRDGHLVIGGGAIVRDGELRTVGDQQLAQDLKRASRKLATGVEAAT